jgi:hypothetical protein
MKLSLSLLSFLFLVISQQSPAQQPEKIYGKNKVLKSNEYYLLQMELWKKETEKDPKNANAWINYYLASRNSYIVGEEKDTPDAKTVNRFGRLKSIVAGMETNVPQSFEYNFVKWMNGNNDLRLFPYLQKAHELAPAEPGPVFSLIYYYEIRGDYEKRDQYVNAYYKLGDYSPGLLNYAYNMLSGLEKNAIIFTEGDKDTDGTLILQGAKGIRKDVRLLNMNLLLIKDYRDRLFKELEIPPLDIDPFSGDENFERYRKSIVEHVTQNSQHRPVYVGETVRMPYTEPIRDKLYLTGLASLYSTVKIDNFFLLKKNYEETYALDYLDSYLPYDISEGNVHAFNANYLSSLILLSSLYTSAGDVKMALKYKEIALKIANDTGHPEEYKKYFSAE